MDEKIIYLAHGLVTVTYRAELKAVYLKWFSEYDEGTRVKDAVLAALDYVRAHHVLHWVADASTSPHALSDKDYEWVSSDDFRSEIQNSPLRKFVLILPLPETGQDVGWVADWQANTLAKFGKDVSAKVCDSADEVRAFLMT